MYASLSVLFMCLQSLKIVSSSFMPFFSDIFILRPFYWNFWLESSCYNVYGLWNVNIHDDIV